MYKRVKKPKLVGTRSHRDAIRRNLLRSLMNKGTVVTTTSRAKLLKQDSSSLIEKGKKNVDNLSFRRKMISTFGNDATVKKFYEYIAKDDAEVRIVKVGFRDGDNAEMSKVYLRGMEKKKIVAKKADKEEKEDKKIVEKQEIRVKEDKKVDKTANIKKVGRSTSRSGL